MQETIQQLKQQQSQLEQQVEQHAKGQSDYVRLTNAFRDVNEQLSASVEQCRKLQVEFLFFLS